MKYPFPRGIFISDAAYRASLNARDIAALRRLKGTAPLQIAAVQLDVRLTQGVIGTHSPAFPLSGEQRQFVNITSDWIQVGSRDIHLLQSVITEAPQGVPVGEDSTFGTRTVGPCSFVRCGDLGAIKQIEIVSYEGDYEILGEDGMTVQRQALHYDRALRFRFARGQVLTLSTDDDAILGEIEIRQSDDIGAVDPHCIVRVREFL